MVIDGRRLDQNAGLSLDQILSIRPLVAPEAPQWSPDGSRIAFVASLGGAANLWSVSPDGGPPTRLTVSLGEVDFLASRIPLWSPDGHFMSYVSKKSGTDEVWLWPANGDAEVRLSHLGGRIHSMSWAPDSRSVAVACIRHGAYDVYRVEVPSGKAVQLTDGLRYDVNPVFTPDGGRIVYVRLDDKWEDHDVMIMAADGKDQRLVVGDSDFFDYTYGKNFGYPEVSADGRTMLFRSQRSGHTNIWLAPIEGGEARPLAPDDAEQGTVGVCIGEAKWSPAGNQVVYTSNHNGTLELRIADADGGESRAVFSPEMGMCSNPQWSPDGSHIAFRYGSPTAPADLWVVSLKDGRARQLTQSSPDSNVADRLTTPEKITYQSFDGQTIHAYVYSPRDRGNGQRYPGLIYIHGGPTNQFYDDLQVSVQYLVERGYVVMLPNIRGSTGYGKAFEKLNDRDWGHGDLKDAIAGADFLKSRAYVTPDKIGITGRSYGGILSMCAVSFAPDAFQAAVPMSGYADWPSLRHEVELRLLKLQEHEFGPFESNQDVWYRCSPFYEIANATTPCFVLNGEGKDPSSDASRAFAEEMKRLYKTVEYKVYHNDGYYVDAPANVRQMLLDVADFLDRYLKDGLE